MRQIRPNADLRSYAKPLSKICRHCNWTHILRQHFVVVPQSTIVISPPECHSIPVNITPDYPFRIHLGRSNQSFSQPKAVNPTCLHSRCNCSDNFRNWFTTPRAFHQPFLRSLSNARGNFSRHTAPTQIIQNICDRSQLGLPRSHSRAFLNKAESIS